LTTNLSLFSSGPRLPPLWFVCAHLRLGNPFVLLTFVSSPYSPSFSQSPAPFRCFVFLQGWFPPLGLFLLSFNVPVCTPSFHSALLLHNRDKYHGSNSNPAPFSQACPFGPRPLAQLERCPNTSVINTGILESGAASDPLFFYLGVWSINSNRFCSVDPLWFGNRTSLPNNPCRTPKSFRKFFHS